MRAHRPMEHIQGFIRSHWMTTSGKYLRLITPVAAMVIEIEIIRIHKNTSKTQCLASNSKNINP
jgi:hypothetical protein